VPFPGGRLQDLSIAWDTEREQWFSLYEGSEIEADDWLHWTRNGQNWNGMCAECHSTDLRKNFDPDTNTYSTEWSEIDVSCEACHGPGSLHVEWAEIDPMGRSAADNYDLVVDTSEIDNRQLVEICAPCHSRRAEIGEYNHSQTAMLENFTPSLLEDGLYHPDGQILDEDYVWASFLQSKMYANDVRCDDCHDVHSLQLHQQGNDLCLQCHQGDTYDTYTHHLHQLVVDDEPSDGALCVKCHMPEQVYMGVDLRADHSIRVPRPDLSLKIGVPNACSQSGCHDDQTVEWAVDYYTQWYGTSRKPHFGEVMAQARSGDPEAEAGLHALFENTLYPTIVRATALNALQNYPGEDTDAAMQRALADEEALLRVTAVDAIGQQAPEEFVERLGPMLFDSVRAVRIRAAARLGGVGREYFKPFQRSALDKELAEYVKATERSLDFAASGMNLANLYASQGDAKSAERYYRMALAVDDLFFPAKLNLAVLVSQQGDSEEAEKLLREILDDYPEQYDAAYSLALLLVGGNRVDEGLHYLALAADGMPRRSRVHYNLGLLLAQLLRDEEAEVALRNALSVEPKNFDYLYALIDFHFKRDQFGKALEYADRMIEAHPLQRFGHDIKAAIENR
jgi:tetratricopeptide (TPR) repeat protein